MAKCSVQLTPRYGTNPIITLDGTPSDILAPIVRQRHRFAEQLSSFTEEQWAHPSRCAGWSNRDVVVHLDSTNSFWAFSIAAGLRGEPTTFLATFDPVASPAQLVAGAQQLSSSEVLDKFVATTTAFTAALGSLSDDDWSVLAEAPPGHISVSALAHHALWDSWVHERDVLLPLGIAPDEEADEIVAALRYGAALAPGFAVSCGLSEKGTLSVATTSPTTAFVVEVNNQVHVRAGSAVGDLNLAGTSVDLLEAFSIRAPLAQPVPANCKWMADGLAKIFDNY